MRPAMLVPPLIAALSIVLICAPADGHDLREVASSRWQWTGIGVTPEHRVFVNYPRWSDRMEYSVAVLDGLGRPSPFPDEAWNDWEPGDAVDKRKFVAVQSVYCDADGSLWVLDTGNPFFQGVVEGGARLFEFEPGTGELLRSYSFAAPVVREESYLNDMRFDLQRGYAFITDSGIGGLVVLNLATGDARRVLADHPATLSEDIDVVIDGEPWRRSGSRPQVHSDGIAYDAASDTVYFHALTARTMYAIRASVLRDASLSDEQIAAEIERVNQDFPVDGLICDAKGRVYLSNLEDSAIDRFDPDASGDRIERVASSPLIAWPDSFSLTSDGWLYVTTAQIHRGDNPPEPYQIFRVWVGE